ncbi:MAG TPA: hypothetical protein VKP65_10215, partial [Rhodothermales bacterium]|nr:hypothetical protein [Rhodothermales bacterium]
EAQIVAFTDQGRPVSLNLSLTAGGFFGGDRLSVAPTLLMRATETFTTEFSIQHNDITLPGGAFVTNLFRARLSYAFTPRIYLQGLVQYNDNADIWSANVRFGWLQAANTGLFIVFNQTNDLDGTFGGPLNRSFTIKYSRMFDVFR